MWDPAPVSALSHGSGLEGNDPLPRHTSRVYYIRNGRPSLVRVDDHSHMGGSHDIKSSAVMVAIMLIWDFIFMFLELDLVLYILGYFTFYMSHYSG